MANRVILGAFDGDYVFRMSKPGNNVLNTALTKEQLVFDSRWPRTGNVVVDGTYSSAAGTGVVRVNFGFTLPALPAVWLWYVFNNENPKWHRPRVVWRANAHMYSTSYLDLYIPNSPSGYVRYIVLQG